jgi:hypothetical protein
MLPCAGVTADAVLDGLAAARAAHSRILDSMEAAVASAPAGPQKFGSVSIDASKIGRLIGAAQSAVSTARL